MMTVGFSLIVLCLIFNVISFLDVEFEVFHCCKKCKYRRRESQTDTNRVSIDNSNHNPQVTISGESAGILTEENAEIKVISDEEGTLLKKTEEQHPLEFICPITMEMMTDPVICSDGHCYERSAIDEWLSSNNTSPMTNLVLQSRQLYPNHSLRSMIHEYRSQNATTTSL